jgi:DNA repair protein RecN (Recombination protein N)
MLTHISIHNFAIVDHLELELNSNMTVLTGKTGAGKSILLDALGLALGDRADSSVIRTDSDRADINVTFDITNIPEASVWLKEREIDNGEECLIRRTINKDGRSKGFINGQPFPIQSLKELGEMLVDLHGQHTHQSLLRKDVQRDTLDAFGVDAKLLSQLKASHKKWHGKKQELDTLLQLQTERSSKLELLRYQVEELDTLNLQENEIAELDQEHQRLAHAGKLLEASSSVLFTLYDNEEGSLINLLQKTVKELDELQSIDENLKPIHTYLANANIQLEEGIHELRHYQSTLEVDPQQLDVVEQRMATIHQLARKHHCQPQQLVALHKILTKELLELENADIRVEHLSSEIDKAAADYTRLAKKVSAARLKAAKSLAKQVSENMQGLGMQGGKFEVQLTPRANDDINQHGMETVSFIVSANPGQPCQALNKVASGGELSRISLAIQVITAATHGIPTLIFDEVDVGIGGGTAEIVGHMLRELGEQRQVLCVTHQPQVAVLGHYHLHVSKQTSKQAVDTNIATLTTEQRIKEIARMLGGIDITKQTLSHAKEMLEISQQTAVLADS